MGMAEGVGFEPTDGRPSPVFKTGAFNHSATLPYQRLRGLCFGLNYLPKQPHLLTLHKYPHSP